MTDPDRSATDTVAAALQAVGERMREYERRHRRAEGSVALLAVSKKKPASAIAAALSAGQRAFGENYVDEALGKIDALKDRDCEWHYIGAIQSRKTRDIAEHFDWVHGVDREKIARRLGEQRPAGRAPLNVCLQVNIDDESSKSGVAPSGLMPLAELCDRTDGIVLRGLMSIPAPRDTLSAQRAVCRSLQALYEPLAAAYPTVDTLSMGMSDDLEAAIAEGSTMVRVGTSIFGSREPT